MNRSKGMFRQTAAVFCAAALFRNPVLAGALGFYPVAAAGYNLKQAAELSLLFLLLAVPANLFACLTGGLMPNWLRPGAVLAASAVCFLPASWILERLMPGAVSSLGMLGGLLICSSVLLSRANKYAPMHLARAVAADTLGCAAGFFLVLLSCALLRGSLLPGGLWRAGESGGGAALPFFGFVVLGFLAAFLQWGNRIRAQRAERKGGMRQ